MKKLITITALAFLIVVSSAAAYQTISSDDLTGSSTAYTNQRKIVRGANDSSVMCVVATNETDNFSYSWQSIDNAETFTGPFQIKYELSMEICPYPAIDYYDQLYNYHVICEQGNTFYTYQNNTLCEDWDNEDAGTLFGNRPDLAIHNQTDIAHACDEDGGGRIRYYNSIGLTPISWLIPLNLMNGGGQTCDIGADYKTPYVCVGYDTNGLTNDSMNVTCCDQLGDCLTDKGMWANWARLDNLSESPDYPSCMFDNQSTFHCVWVHSAGYALRYNWFNPNNNTQGNATTLINFTFASFDNPDYATISVMNNNEMYATIRVNSAFSGTSAIYKTNYTSGTWSTGYVAEERASAGGSYTYQNTPEQYVNASIEEYVFTQNDANPDLLYGPWNASAPLPNCTYNMSYAAGQILFNDNQEMCNSSVWNVTYRYTDGPLEDEFGLYNLMIMAIVVVMFVVMASFAMRGGGVAVFLGLILAIVAIAIIWPVITGSAGELGALDQISNPTIDVWYNLTYDWIVSGSELVTNGTYNMTRLGPP